MTCWRWWRVWLGRTPAYDCLIVATVAAPCIDPLYSERVVVVDGGW